MKKEPIHPPDSWSPDPRHADPLQDRLHALVEEWDSSAPFGADWTHDAADAMRGALAELASLQATLRETLEERTRERDELDEKHYVVRDHLEACRVEWQAKAWAAEATLRAALSALKEIAEEGNEHSYAIAKKARETALGSSPDANPRSTTTTTILRAEAGSADADALLPQRPEGAVRATAPERTEAVRGKLVGIDALLINALAVCDGEAALRLAGARQLAADALNLLAQ